MARPRNCVEPASDSKQRPGACFSRKFASHLIKRGKLLFHLNLSARCPSRPCPQSCKDMVAAASGHQGGFHVACLPRKSVRNMFGDAHFRLKTRARATVNAIIIGVKKRASCNRGWEVCRDLFSVFFISYSSMRCILPSTEAKMWFRLGVMRKEPCLENVRSTTCTCFGRSCCDYWRETSASRCSGGSNNSTCRHSRRHGTSLPLPLLSPMIHDVMT